MQAPSTTLNKAVVAPATQPAIQPQQTQQAAEAPAPKPAAEQTSFAKQDGFEAPAQKQQAVAQRPADLYAAPATLQAPPTLEPAAATFDPTFQPLGAYEPPAWVLDQKGGGGGLVQQTPTFDPTFQPLGAYEPPAWALAPKGGGGGLVQQTPTFGTIGIGTPNFDKMAAARHELLQDQQFIQGVKLGTLTKDPVLMGKLEYVGKLAAAEADPSKPMDPNDPTVGMSPAERKKYDALPPEEKARYDELHRQACATEPAAQSVQALRNLLTNGEFGKYLEVEQAVQNDPQAQANLQKLLFEGKLDERSEYSGRTTLYYIHQLATGQPPDKTGQGVDRKQLLSGLLQDLAHPDTIQQGEGNKDCAGTAAAIGMATADPAEYARIITTLAEKGEVHLTPLWAQLRGEPDVVLRFKGPPTGDRPITQELFAKPWVDAAASGSAGATEDAGKGKGSTPWAQRLNQLLANLYGLNGSEFAYGLNMGSGDGWQPAYMPPVGDPERAQAEADATKILQGATKEKPVYALIDGHWVTVTGVKNGQVTYLDGNGHKKTVSMEEFMGKLNTVCFQNGEVPASMDDPADGGRGGDGSSNGDLDGGGSLRRR